MAQHLMAAFLRLRFQPHSRLLDRLAGGNGLTHPLADREVFAVIARQEPVNDGEWCVGGIISDGGRRCIRHATRWERGRYPLFGKRKRGEVAALGEAKALPLSKHSKAIVGKGEILYLSPLMVDADHDPFPLVLADMHNVPVIIEHGCHLCQDVFFGSVEASWRSWLWKKMMLPQVQREHLLGIVLCLHLGGKAPMAQMHLIQDKGRAPSALHRVWKGCGQEEQALIIRTHPRK